MWLGCFVLAIQRLAWRGAGQTSICAAMDYSQSEIASFYAGRSVFITGATGFMGKV